MTLDAVMGAVDDATPGAARPKALAFTRFLMLHLVARAWVVLADAGVPRWQWALAVGLTLAAGAACFAPTARRATAVVLALMSLKLVAALPAASNHLFLETGLVGLLVFLDPWSDDEAPFLLRGMKCATVIVFFTTGLQKLWYGTYLGGQFLAFTIANVDTFRAALGFLVAPDELARLRSYAPLEGGPYRVASPLFLLASNASWIAEMALPVLLVPLRTRAFALVGAVLFVVAIEAAAREIFFGMLFAELLLLFAPRDATTRTLPFAAAFYAYLLLMRWSVLPAWSFSN